MDRIVVDSKLEALRRCVQRVEQRCPPTLEVLLADLDAQDVVVLNLSRAVQLCVDIAMHWLAQADTPTPPTMGQAFEELCQRGVIDAHLSARLRAAVGFRNLATHNYEQLNWAIVFSIATTHLKDFRAFAQAVTQHLGDALS